MKKGDVVSILDGVLRVFIVILTCHSMFTGKDIIWEIIILGIMISCFSLIYTYKKNIGRMGISYFFSIFIEFALIGLEFFTGIIGALIDPLFPIIENDPAPGTGLALMGDLFGFIIITAVERIVLGIIEFIRWYKESKEQQIKDFCNTMIHGGKDLFHLKYKFIQGNKMHGIVVGGNIRCFLKLAGTEYMPELDNKILLLESYGGTVAKIETYLCQLQQMGAFDKVAGVILGTFTEMETEKCIPTAEILVKRIVRNDLPIAVTRDIGHGTDSKGIVIGQELYLEK